MQTMAVDGRPGTVTTSGAMAEYEQLRQRHLTDLASLMAEHVQRLRWPAGRLAVERRDRLRDLLRVARAAPPWHRDRLAGIDPGRSSPSGGGPGPPPTPASCGPPSGTGRS